MNGDNHRDEMDNITFKQTNDYTETRGNKLKEKKNERDYRVRSRNKEMSRERVVNDIKN